MSTSQDEVFNIKSTKVTLVNSIYTGVVKRGLDFIIASLLLLLLFPAFLTVWLLVKSEDINSPVIFKQDRVGRNNQVFTMYKFRSMINNAEDHLLNLQLKNEAQGPMFKIKQDPRITKFGRQLRKYSIDELPQLLNVIKGDMSLVGPRPALTSEVTEYNNFEKQRYLVKPGITGLWQVSGRSNLTFDQMIELDLRYIQTVSIHNDFKILLKTVVVVFNSNGAY